MKLLCLVFLIAVLGYSDVLACRCSRTHIPIEQRCLPNPTNCKGSLVPDKCQCCLECARVLGEPCGWQMDSGTCDTGLICEKTPGTETPIQVVNSGTCKLAADIASTSSPA